MTNGSDNRRSERALLVGFLNWLNLRGSHHPEWSVDDYLSGTPAEKGMKVHLYQELPCAHCHRYFQPHELTHIRGASYCPRCFLQVDA